MLKYLKLRKNTDEIVEHSELKSKLENTKAGWQFNIEHAPWWGGAFSNAWYDGKICQVVFKKTS